MDAPVYGRCRCGGTLTTDPRCPLDPSPERSGGVAVPASPRGRAKRPLLEILDEARRRVMDESAEAGYAYAVKALAEWSEAL